MNSVRIHGRLESIGNIIGGIGAEIRSNDGKLLIIPGLTPDQIRDIAPLLFQDVCVIITATLADEKVAA